MPGTFTELRERLSGIVPTEWRHGATAIMFVYTRDPKYTGPAWVRRLVAAGFAVATRSSVLRRIAPALVDDDLIEERGVSDEDLPCIAFFVANAGATPIVLRLPPASWSTPQAWKRLRTVFKEEFSSARILELARKLPAGAAPSSFREAFARHVQYVQRQLIPATAKMALPKNRGRPRHPSTEQDKQIVDAWLFHSFDTYDQLARELGVDADDVKRAVDRARKAKDRRRK